MTELFNGVHMGQLKPSQNITCFVNPTGVVIVKATIMNASMKKDAWVNYLSKAKYDFKKKINTFNIF